MARTSTNRLIHFVSVKGFDHFSILAPANDLIASKILHDEVPTISITFSDEELNETGSAEIAPWSNVIKGCVYEISKRSEEAGIRGRGPSWRRSRVQVVGILEPLLHFGVDAGERFDGIRWVIRSFFSNPPVSTSLPAAFMLSKAKPRSIRLVVAGLISAKTCWR